MSVTKRNDLVIGRGEHIKHEKAYSRRPSRVDDDYFFIVLSSSPVS